MGHFFWQVIAIILILIFPQIIQAQTDSSDTPDHKADKIKEGWNFGALPSVLYNTDIGFQYGLLVNLFNYGDGSYYPGYKHQFYAEWARTTKGGGINQLFFDSKYLLPNEIRTTFDISYLTEKALDFYGFNGYEADYIAAYEDDEDSAYISRMYYRMQRKALRVCADFQGRLLNERLHWVGGLAYFDTQIATVDTAKLNKGKDEEDKLPQTDLLYDKYVDWGVITAKEKAGGQNFFLKAGIVYDSRDNQSNAMRGIWSEAVIMAAPSFLGNKEFSYARYAITHRQYFTLVREKLSLAYRLAYQGNIGPQAPFYMENYRLMSFELATEKE